MLLPDAPFRPAPLHLLEGAPDMARAHLLGHWRRLGRRSRRLRFMRETPPEALDRLSERAAPEILIEVEADGALRGVLEAYATKPGHAEIALSVEDGYQGRGLGRALFEKGLLARARRGVLTASLLCLTENQAVLRLVRAAGGQIRVEGLEVAAEIELGRALQALRSPAPH